MLYSVEENLDLMDSEQVDQIIEELISTSAPSRANARATASPVQFGAPTAGGPDRPMRALVLPATSASHLRSVARFDGSVCNA